MPDHRRAEAVASPEDVRWLDTPNFPPDPGWAEVVTPLGASVHVIQGSLTWDLCTEWSLLNSGRGALALSDPAEWFEQTTLESAPAGIVAELLASGGRMCDFVQLLTRSAQARAHILRLSAHVFGAEPEEWELLGDCSDIARALELRAAAQAAAREADT